MLPVAFMSGVIVSPNQNSMVIVLPVSEDSNVTDPKVPCSGTYMQHHNTMLSAVSAAKHGQQSHLSDLSLMSL
jgi:hypothetical protein